MASTPRGFGIATNLDDDVITATAELVESLGYSSLWTNNPPNSDGLSTLAKAASVSSQIPLGVGVIPVTHHPVDEMAERVNSMGNDGSLPTDRLLLGIGSGRGPGALDRVRSSIAVLREKTDAKIYLAALGPKMCSLAGELADGVLFNWLTPEYAVHSANLVKEGAAAAGRPTPRLVTYVRVALGSDAYGRLLKEAERYNSNPSYNNNFKRMGVEPVETAVTGNTAEEIRQGLEAWEGVLDEYVVRSIIANDTREEMLELARAAAPSS